MTDRPPPDGLTQPPSEGVYYTIDGHLNSREWPDNTGLPAGYWLDAKAAEAALDHWIAANPRHKALAAKHAVRVTGHRAPATARRPHIVLPPDQFTEKVRF